MHGNTNERTNDKIPVADRRYSNGYAENGRHKKCKTKGDDGCQRTFIEVVQLFDKIRMPHVLRDIAAYEAGKKEMSGENNDGGCDAHQNSRQSVVKQKTHHENDKRGDVQQGACQRCAQKQYTAEHTCLRHHVLKVLKGERIAKQIFRAKHQQDVQPK